MKKKNILFQTAVVACLLFGTGINMSSCIEQTFPKSSTAISEQIAESPAAMKMCIRDRYKAEAYCSSMERCVTDVEAKLSQWGEMCIRDR